MGLAESQSPDGDFFDPEEPIIAGATPQTVSHSPLTGIFLIRSGLTPESPDFRGQVTVP